MDNTPSIYERLAMILHDQPGARVIVTGRWMPGVRAACSQINRRMQGMRQTISSSSHLHYADVSGSTLDGWAPPAKASGRPADAVLYVGEVDERASRTLDGFGAAGALVYQTIGV